MNRGATVGTATTASALSPAAGPRDARKAGPTARARRAKTTTIAYLFLAPSAIPLVAFVVVPMFRAAWASLHTWNLISPMEWTGLSNYQELFTDKDTLVVFGHTMYYVAGTLPLTFVGGLALALGLNRAFKGRNLLRGVYFLPVVTSWIAVAIVWRWLLNPSVGVVNTVLANVGIDGPGWWTDPAWSMPSIILASAWKDLGYVMVLLLAGLQTIPTDVQEAATLDGVGWFSRLRSVTLPLLSPQIFFVVIISLINGFQVFDQVYAMTGGGPNGSSEVVVERVYDLTFRYGQAGMASALSMLLFAVILLITLIQIRGERKWVNYA
ncbi:sugar ABC transporter permease [Demequina sp. TTPB684]|uniref:carbohydrate ABC transporter permease n=1 Tax=unclassified Demequina TaxID=2620311 RepID=UPI001CF249D0|nr:sugar ABC transporter permease [Demequina sp. TMPB413]MCB2413152.1 sugar ABC transporter permease [Demequina sp. TTPB684]UPU89658.1 sugar ABC transporter permease [Demequina sp. TMPB413]